jgi:hypothetical protein
MSSDSEDEIWLETYPRTIGLLINPVGNIAVLIPMTAGTKLPYSYRSIKITFK